MRIIRRNRSRSQDSSKSSEKEKKRVSLPTFVRISSNVSDSSGELPLPVDYTFSDVSESSGELPLPVDYTFSDVSESSGELPLPVDCTMDGDKSELSDNSESSREFPLPNIAIDGTRATKEAVNREEPNRSSSSSAKPEGIGPKEPKVDNMNKEEGKGGGDHNEGSRQSEKQAEEFESCSDDNKGDKSVKSDEGPDLKSSSDEE